MREFNDNLGKSVSIFLHKMIKRYSVGTHLNHLAKAILMSTHVFMEN